jgi:hypothetical protein
VTHHDREYSLLIQSATAPTNLVAEVPLISASYKAALNEAGTGTVVISAEVAKIDPQCVAAGDLVVWVKAGDTVLFGGFVDVITNNGGETLTYSFADAFSWMNRLLTSTDLDLSGNHEEVLDSIFDQATSAIGYEFLLWIDYLTALGTGGSAVTASAPAGTSIGQFLMDTANAIGYRLSLVPVLGGTHAVSWALSFAAPSTGTVLHVPHNVTMQSHTLDASRLANKVFVIGNNSGGSPTITTDTDGASTYIDRHLRVSDTTEGQTPATLAAEILSQVQQPFSRTKLTLDSSSFDINQFRLGDEMTLRIDAEVNAGTAFDETVRVVSLNYTVSGGSTTIDMETINADAFS